MRKEIPIFFAVDDNYAPFLGVTLQSIKDHSSRDYTYLIHVMHPGLKKSTIDRLLKMQDENYKVICVDVKHEVKKVGNLLFTRDYYTNTTYYRFFIQRLFPQFDKALYLDSDLLVVDDISKLFNVDLGDNLIGAAVEDIMTNVDVFGRYVEVCLGIDRYKYFNAGVMLLNLKKFREEDIEARFIELLAKFKFRVTQDEDYLNVLAKGRVCFVCQGWNKSPMRDPSFDDDKLKIVHFKINYKPWHYDNVRYAENYWDYALKTEFYDDLRHMRRHFSAEDIERDNKGFQGLAILAENEIEREDTYNIIVNGSRSIA